MSYVMPYQNVHGYLQLNHIKERKKKHEHD